MCVLLTQLYVSVQIQMGIIHMRICFTLWKYKGCTVLLMKAYVTGLPGTNLNQNQQPSGQEF